MLNFNYFNPTQIVFGENRLEELDKLVPANAKVLVTFGGQSAKKYGTIDKVRTALKEREVFEFGGIEPNPRYTTLVKALDVIKENNIDFLLAVGGGSVMDGTKFIAIAAEYKNDQYQEILYNGFSPVPTEKALPLGCVVTLPATGSEMNMGGVITYNNQKYPVMSPLTFPKFSFLAPELTKTLPEKQVANGIADAFVHVVEQYITFPVDAKIQDRFSEGILQTLIEDGPVTLKDNENPEARKNFIWAATMALNGLIGSGVPQDWATHLIGHELTAMFGIDHGRTLSIVLPSLLRERKDKKREKLVQFAERVWNITEGSEDEKIENAIVKTEEFFNSLGIDTKLSQYGIKEEEIETVVKNMENMGLNNLSESRDLTLEIVKKILKAAY